MINMPGIDENKLLASYKDFEQFKDTPNGILFFKSIKNNNVVIKAVLKAAKENKLSELEADFSVFLASQAMFLLFTIYNFLNEKEQIKVFLDIMEDLFLSIKKLRTKSEESK